MIDTIDISIAWHGGGTSVAAWSYIDVEYGVTDAMPVVPFAFVGVDRHRAVDGVVGEEVARVARRDDPHLGEGHERLDQTRELDRGDAT